MRPVHLPPALAALAGGLLASSCCLVQLALNAFGLGCAGFAALDAWRAPALAAGLAALAAAHGRHRSKRRTVVWLSVMLALATSPEWTAAVGKAGGVRAWAASARGAPPLPPPSLHFTLTGVKCAACGERARAAAAAAAGPGAAASVDWREGRVRVAGAAAATRAGAVRAALEEAGFGVVVQGEGEGREEL